MWQKAFSVEFSMARRDISRASGGVIEPARNASTREQASPVQVPLDEVPSIRVTETTYRPDETAQE